MTSVNDLESIGRHGFWGRPWEWTPAALQAAGMVWVAADPGFHPGLCSRGPSGRPSRASPVPRPNGPEELRACERIGLKTSDCEFQMHKSLASLA